ncbi:MAG: hypothetical protein QNK37_32770 [Acidobacteriota bacterium]|nr:hypothetical protein [Acidobacteriota bacterium]
MIRYLCCLILLSAVFSSAEEPPGKTPQDLFWTSLQGLCGKNFHGRVEINTSSTQMDGLPRIEVKNCEKRRMEIAFHVGEDRSRTWILTRTSSGLRLKHDHRHEDGTPDKITDYGGDTYEIGQPTRQEFDVDDYTVKLVPGTDKNVWVMELFEGKSFAYELYKGKTTPVFRVVFDLSTEVE